MTTVARGVILSVFATALSGCAAPPDSEQALRALVDAAERAAEARDTGHFATLISPDYRDARGNDRSDLVNALRGYFLLHQKVEILTRIEQIAVHDDEAADVVVSVASVGLRGRVAGALREGFSGDFERVELEVVREGGEWRLIGATWR